jgi:hypothetical protein
LLLGDLIRKVQGLQLGAVTRKEVQGERVLELLSQMKGVQPPQIEGYGEGGKDVAAGNGMAWLVLAPGGGNNYIFFLGGLIRATNLFFQ